MTGPAHAWGAYRYDLIHNLRHIRRAKDEWIIQALHVAIKRLPRCCFNDERRDQIKAMQIGLEQQASFEREFLTVRSRCT